jgi:hypothetical protein
LGASFEKVRKFAASRRVFGLLLVLAIVLGIWVWFQGFELLFGSRPDTSASLSLLGLIAVAACVALTLWLVPRVQMARWRSEGIKGKDLAELGNSARATLTQAVGGLALIATLALTAYQVNETRKVSERNIKVTEEGQATQLLAHAVDQRADGRGAGFNDVAEPGSPFDKYQVDLVDLRTFADSDEWWGGSILTDRTTKW